MTSSQHDEISFVAKCGPHYLAVRTDRSGFELVIRDLWRWQTEIGTKVLPSGVLLAIEMRLRTIAVEKGWDKAS